MKKVSLLQIIIHAGGWIPQVLIIIDFFSKHLTANPIQAIEQRTGLQALTFLLLSLACTPLSWLMNWKELLIRRKALGLYGFMYAFIHLFIFLGLDYGFNFNSILKDVGTKTYIILGLLAFLLLLALALTSFKIMMKKMGKNWKKLHRLVYIISPLVVIHFLLSVKGNIGRLQGNIQQPLLYGSIVILLLVLRLPEIKKLLLALRKKVIQA
ncbi:MAG: protein-methionine-sulfoxide reductase heme-binding subunit MsrQ [Chloroflexota bacterium]